MNKKAIAILGAIFLLIVGTLGFLIYSKYGTKKTPEVVVNVPNNGGGDPTPSVTPTPEPTVAASGANKLLDGPIVSPALFYNGQGVTYFDAAGQLYQVNIQQGNGQPQASSPQPLGIQTKANITKVIWPPLGDDFITESVSGSQKSWSFYNSKSRIYQDIPSQVVAFDWLPSGQQVYYIWVENGKAALNVGDPNTQNWKYIADMWETDDVISVSPDGKNILYYEQNTATSTNPINWLTSDGKLWKTLVSTGINYGVLWSPDSQKFLFGKKDSTGTTYQLWFYNLLTGEVGNTKLNATVEKAVWSKDSQTIYAAVPNSGDAGNGGLTADMFNKFNIATGDKKQYDAGAQVIDGENLFLSSDESLLLFKNAQDGGLYYLNLNQ